MALPSLSFLNTFSNFVAKASKTVAIAAAIIVFCVGRYTSVYIDGMAAIVTKMTALRDSTTGIQHANFAGLDMIAYVNGVFPLSETIGCITIYTTAWLIVLAIRWLKSFIPTMGN